MPVVCPMSRLSLCQMANVAASILPFVMDCHRRHSEEGIAVGGAHNGLGRSLVSNRL